MAVIFNPVSRRLTHVVVSEKQFPHIEHLVPVELVIDSSPKKIWLRCTCHELQKMEQFIETEFVTGTEPHSVYSLEEYRLWPYVLPDPEMGMVVEHEKIPPGELAVRRGAHVEATDGRIGQVDEFLLDPDTMHVTHLVLREGHLWSQKEVTIPVSEIDRIEEEVVYLKLDKHSVGELPAIPVRRWNEGEGDE